MSVSLLIIGLGNPGTRYELTRHNIGFMVVDALANELKAAWERPSSLYDVATVRYAGRQAVLAKPLTYMNESGKAAKKLMGQFKLTPQQIVCVVDEYNFPVGKVHLRPEGSDGGHNGITSMIEELGTPKFWRLRCGIDRKFGPGGLVDYVLSPFDESDRLAPSDPSNPVSPSKLERMISRGVDALKLIIKQGPQQAMQLVNRSDPGVL
jgi:PTH1 family peptidyl-tRNA hydrolase